MVNKIINNSTELKSQSLKNQSRLSLEERFKNIPANRMKIIENVNATVLQNIDVFHRLKDK